MNQYQQYFETFPFQLALDMSFDRLMRRVDIILAGPVDRHFDPWWRELTDPHESWALSEKHLPYTYSRGPFIPPIATNNFVVFETEDYSWVNNLPKPKRFHWDIFWIWTIGTVIWLLSVLGLCAILHYFTT